MSASLEGKVLGLALRTERHGAMQEVERVTAAENGGVEHNRKVVPDRGVTFISSEQWREVQEELDAPTLPWHTRRANVLVEGLVMAELLGKTVRVGDVVIEIKRETDPCGQMDAAFKGLRAALNSDCRGGVHGQVVRGGSFAIGDRIIVNA